jgi:hypothetical protein
MSLRLEGMVFWQYVFKELSFIIRRQTKGEMSPVRSAPLFLLYQRLHHPARAYAALLSL